VRDALPLRTLREHLGPLRFETPVGMQIMGSETAAVAETARRAAEVGAPLVDLNFGCPAKGALRSCAGSALLNEPAALERLIRACVDAVEGRVPVTAKIRAGYDDDRLIEELARAVEQGGASLLTVHCRTRKEHYCPEVDWSRIERAVRSTSLPVCGNGGVSTHADLGRMRDETGCAFVMVGRAALGNPWIFGGREATPADAARFLLDYAQTLRARSGISEKGIAGRVKQLLHHWPFGWPAGTPRDDGADGPRSWLREAPGPLLDKLASIAGPARNELLNPVLPQGEPQPPEILV
jgi:tRNA-dihydrouridine synthase C